MGTDTIKLPKGFKLDITPPEGFELEVKPPDGFELDEQQEEAPSTILSKPLSQSEITEQQELEQRNALYKYMRENPEAIRKIQRQNENIVIQDYFAGLPETRTPYEARERRSRSTLALEGPDDSYWRKTYLTKAKRAQVKKLQEQGLIPDERREYKGFWDELGRNTVGGSLNVASGLTGTLASMSEGAIWDPNKLEQWAQKLHEKSMEPAYTAAKGGGWKGFVGASIGQAAPYMAAATASVIVTGQPYAAFGVGFSVEGDNAYRDALDAGATEEQAQMNRLVVGTINGAIEQIQVSQIFKFARAGKGSIQAVSKLAQQKAMKKIAAKGGKLTLEALQHSARESLEEALQETTSIAAEARINPEAWTNATERILRAGAGGGVVSLVLGSGGRIMSRGGTKTQIKESLDQVQDQEKPRTAEQIKADRQQEADIAEMDREYAEITETPSTEAIPGPDAAIQPSLADKGLELPSEAVEVAPEAKVDTPEDALWELGNAQSQIGEAIQKHGYGGITESEQHPDVVKASRLIEEKSNQLYDNLSPKHKIGETVSYQSYAPAGTYTVAKQKPDGTFEETPNKEKIGKPRQVKITQAKFDLAQSADNIRRIGIPTTFSLNHLEARDVETGEKVFIYPHERVNKETLSETIQVNPTEVLKDLVEKTKSATSPELVSRKPTKALAQPPTVAKPAPAVEDAQGAPERGTKLTMGFDPGLEEFIAEDIKPTIAKAKKAAKSLKEIGLAAPKLFMKLVEPAKATEKMARESYTATIKAIHTGTDVAQVEWENQRIESMDMNMDQLKKWFGQFSEEENHDFFVAYAGKPGSIEAEMIQREARKRLPDALKQENLVKAIREISEKNHEMLRKVVGDNVGWVKDYFYGIYKNPKVVFAKWKKSTKRFTKHKVIPSLADVINMGSEALHNNYIDNLKAEYMGIARLGAMKWLKSELLRTGEGRYIDNMMDAPPDWQSVKDPVFAAYLLKPELAELINNLISTNKITQQPVLNAFRKVGNILRITKFIGSIFHLRTIMKQAAADSGYLGFLHKKTALRGFQTATKKQWAKLRQTPEYKRLLGLGIGHRYSYEEQAQKQFQDIMDKITSGNFLGASLRAARIPIQIPVKFTGWLFNQYIPMVKTLKVLDAQMELEKKEGRPATDWEIINIIKETQNFYGMMNERLFGRSGTVTTGMRFVYLSPGFAEGNYRTILKALLQWGWGGKEWSASRSRANMPNSLLITGTIATLGTLMLTGKQPKKPETVEDIRDLFKIDTGKKDPHGRKVMIDMMTYDKDYFNVYFNVLRARPDVAAYESLRRMGGMKSPMFDMMLDFARMSTGQAIYDWKGDRVTEITDTSLEKLMKIAIHEIKKTEPISVSVFKQARKKEVDKIISFVQAVMGVRPTLTEKDKREGEILRRCWSLKDQKEGTYRDLATLHRPREAVKWYNNKVKDVLESRLVPKSMKEEWIPKLTIDLEKYLQNKALDASRLPTNKDSEEQIEKAVKILKNFKISPDAAGQLLTDYYNREKAKTDYRPIESDRILGRAMKKKRLKERMQD